MKICFQVKSNVTLGRVSSFLGGFANHDLDFLELDWQNAQHTKHTYTHCFLPSYIKLRTELSAIKNQMYFKDLLFVVGCCLDGGWGGGFFWDLKKKRERERIHKAFWNGIVKTGESPFSLRITGLLRNCSPWYKVSGAASTIPSK